MLAGPGSAGVSFRKQSEFEPIMLTPRQSFTQ
jgi:hypothetical protein